MDTQLGLEQIPQISLVIKHSVFHRAVLSVNLTTSFIQKDRHK